MVRAAIVAMRVRGACGAGQPTFETNEGRDRTQRRSCGDGRALRGRSIATGREKTINRTAHFGSVTRAGRARERRVDRETRPGVNPGRYDGARLRRESHGAS